MTSPPPDVSPRFCPNPRCLHHRRPGRWRWRRDGFYTRQARPRRIQRFRCLDCGRSFSTQTFSTTYWLRKPELLPLVHRSLVECGAFRQAGRGLRVSHSTVAGQAARLGRHCLLYHQLHRPRELPSHALALDGLRTFVQSQYWPCDLNWLIDSKTFWNHGFTASELRRSGRMTAAQRLKRARLEARLGRPDPQATRKEVEALLRIVLPEGRDVLLLQDRHPAYDRAIARLKRHRIRVKRTSSKTWRDGKNSLLSVNATDLLFRHSSANHKRETIAFSKRMASLLERAAVWVVWRNFTKRRREKSQSSPTPAMAMGLRSSPLTTEELLSERLFPTRVELPERWARYYWREVPTRSVRNCRRHALKYAA